MALTISINPLVSPRIITVLAPDVAISMQELVNMVRDWEDDQIDTEYDYIIDAYGKQDLGSGVLVGITVVLRNAKLAFEARGGPDYVQCNVSGGNLVAIDENGDSMSPIQPTAFTQVVLTSSSSATLQEETTIQYASFNDGVAIDVINGEPGTAYPLGSSGHPVDNLADAIAIAEERGFHKLYFLSDYTFANGTSISGYDLIGQGMQKTTLTFESGAITEDCYIVDALATGDMIGIIGIRNCYVYSLSGSNPVPFSQSILIRDCVLGGTIIFANNYSGIAQLVGCWADNAGTILDLNGAAMTLAIRGFTGNVLIKNNTSAATVTADLTSGTLTIDSSCYSGSFAIRGSGLLVDNSTSTVNADGLLNQNTVWTAQGFSSAVGFSGSYGEKVFNIEALSSLIPATL